jgi:3-oxoacyl-[acyl-carrier protein] reductase
MNTLQGKTALVTGASRGIGRATALALADAGARVLVHYAHAAAEANTVVAEIREVGGHADSLKADLVAADGPAVLTNSARRILGDRRLDILVLKAGISRAASIENQTAEDFDGLFSINVRSPFFLVQQLLPLLPPRAKVPETFGGLRHLMGYLLKAANNLIGGVLGAHI